ncbi:MAG: hypothetical protein O2917_04890 [Acidobacteria bacterium]|nr:hypothetical protein [Acidobacteriota bacterium]
MQRRILAAAAAIVMVGSAAVWLHAQAAVTVHFRNGDSMQAMLVDLKAGGFEFLVRGDSRMIPTDQVAMVDFGARVNVPNSAFRDMSPIDHLIVFRNGDTMLAEWVDVGGTSPLRIAIRSRGNERDLSSNDIARIYLVRPRNEDADGGGRGGRGGVAVPRPGMQEDGSIRVEASLPWTDTSMQVRTGEFLLFDVTRAIRVDDSGGTVTADGVSGRAARPRGLPVASMPRGGLIGRVGSSQPFAIGTAPEPIRMPANGRLWLGINELDVDDNSGWFRVVITRTR